MQVRFLFWNIMDKKNPFEDTIGRIVSENSIDILILAENDNIKPNVIEGKTNLTYLKQSTSKSKTKWLYLFYRKEKLALTGIDVFKYEDDNDVIDKKTGDSRELAKYLNKKERLIAYNITVGKTSYLLFGLHFPSKIYCSNTKQEYLARKMKTYIERMEKEVKHQNTIIVGDFNMNPFEKAMLLPDAFNASMSINFTNKSKKVYDINESAFYNPTWVLTGDFHSRTNERKVPGTLYYDDMDEQATYWQLYDQVIFRPGMESKFISSSLEILEGFKNTDKSFLNEKSEPNTENFSDHLPIKFTFNL
jgi:exonuclease III